MVRYADDFLVLCKSEEEAKGAIIHVKEILEELELTLHPEKTKVKNFSEGLTFLVSLFTEVTKYHRKRLLKDQGCC